MKKAKPALVLLMKVLVSAGLLVFFFTRIHIERFFHTFASADFSYIALALVVYFFSQFLSTLRWEVLARPLGFKKPFMVFLNFYLIGMFFNLFAPGTVGGDVSRIYYLARDEEGGREKNWGGATLNYRGSMVSLFYSQYATGVFKCCGTVYSPPTRNYAFDTDFLDLSKLPPGTPKFRDIVNVGFQQVF